MLSYQLRKRGQVGLAQSAHGDAAVQQAREAAGVLLDSLAPRLAQVALHCSDEQLARALWAYGASRRHRPEVIAVGCEELPRRLGSMQLDQLATAAWGLAAAARSEPHDLHGPVRELLQTIANHLVATRPPSLSLPPAQPPPAADTSAAASAAEPGPAAARTPLSAATSHAAAAIAAAGAGPRQPAAAEVSAAAAERSAAAAERPWMDHRSALKLAWAFAAADVRDAQALNLIGDAAAARIDSQLRAHSAASGPLSPRATYLYRAIRGWQAWPRPRPPRIGTSGRTSRYMYDERPRVVLRDFTLASLAPLLDSFRRLEHPHQGLLQASAQHLLASAGPSLRVSPPDLTRVLAAYNAARFTHAGALAALLGHTQLQAVPAPALLWLTTLAASWGVRRRNLYERMLRQLVARAWVTRPKADSVAALPERLRGAEGAEGAGAGGGEAALIDPRVVENVALAAPVSWRASPERREEEAAAWHGAKYREEDRCEAADVANCLWALSKLGLDKSEWRPLLAPLFADLLPVLGDRSQLSPDSLARLAAVSAHFGMAGFASEFQKAADILTDMTRLALYGEPAIKAKESQSRQVLLHSVANSGDAAAAARLRREIGLSERGAALLADALTRQPAERPTPLQDTDDLRALLALVEPDSVRVSLLERIRHVLTSRGAGGALPRRLRAEEPPAVGGGEV